MDKMRKVGILGGTFDPIHNGHLVLADCAYRQYHLDEVRFIPAGIPPHKRSRKDGASDAQRLRMVELAVQGDPRFSVDTMEMERGGVSFTKDTLQILKEREPDTEFYFIIGADSLMSLDTWRDPETICRLCHLLAACRDDADEAAINAKIKELKNRFGASVFLLDAPLTPISSHALRRMCRAEEPVDTYVPGPVLSYLNEENIYRS